MPKNKEGKALSSYAQYSSIAIQMFVIIGVGTYGGVKLDQLYQNRHDAYTIILSLVSVILSIVFVIRRIIANSKEHK